MNFFRWRSPISIQGERRAVSGESGIRIFLSLLLAMPTLVHAVDTLKSVKVGKDQIAIPKCWSISDTKVGTDQPLTLQIASTDSCSKKERGSWQILYKEPFSSIHGIRADSENRQRIVGYGEEKKLKVGRANASFYGRVTDDHLEQWIARFECGDLMLQAEYLNQLKGEGSDQARKKNEIPVPLKTFVKGYQCSGKR